MPDLYLRHDTAETRTCLTLIKASETLRMKCQRQILGICWLQQTSKDVIFRPILETAMEIMLKLLICFIHLVEKSL